MVNLLKAVLKPKLVSRVSKRIHLIGPSVTNVNKGQALNYETRRIITLRR
jgi:hypothetical protein